jgi:SM-20-related protein
MTTETLYELLIEGIIEQGYGVADAFVSPNELAALRKLLLQHYADGHFKQAGIGKGDSHQHQTGIRGDSILWLEQDSEAISELGYMQHINDFISYLNHSCFTGLNSFELHYAHYPTGTFYKKHTDRFTNDQSRAYSLIMYLNEDWKEDDGGELLLYLDNGQEHKILPLGGRVVCFPSHVIPHEVLPAKKLRLSLTGWLKK